MLQSGRPGRICGIQATMHGSGAQNASAKGQ